MVSQTAPSLFGRPIPWFQIDRGCGVRSQCKLPSTFFKESLMKVLFINNDGGGFADHIDVAAGTKVSELFAQRISGRKSEDYLIRVNRLPAAADQVLQEGDRVSIT